MNPLLGGLNFHKDSSKQFGKPLAFQAQSLGLLTLLLRNISINIAIMFPSLFRMSIGILTILWVGLWGVVFSGSGF